MTAVYDENIIEKQENESTKIFQNSGLRRLLMILYHGWYLRK